MVNAAGPARTSASALRPEVRHVIEQARDLPQLADPMDAEMLTGRALTEAALSVSSTPMHASLPPGMALTFSGPLSDPPTSPDPSALTFDGSTEHALWSAVIDHAAATPSRRSLALLRAMAVLVSDAPTAAQAATQADVLAASDVPEPPWTRAILDLEPAECWIADDQAHSGFVTVVCAHRYPGRRHAIAVFIDHMMGGLAKNAFATAKLDELRARFSFVPAPPAEAYRLVAEAYRLVYAHPELPVDPDVHRLRMLVHRRIRQGPL